LGVLLLGATTGPATAHVHAYPQLGRTTTLQGGRVARFLVRVARGTVVDLTPTKRSGGLHPRALTATGGSGFVGFFLNGTGAAAGHSVLAVRLPDAESNAAGARVTAVGWGRDHGGACTKCTLHGGTYELDLLTADRSSGPASVTLRTSSRLPDAEVLRARDGLPSDVVEVGSEPHTGPSLPPPAPLYPYAGGFWETIVAARNLVPAVVVDQMTMDITAAPGTAVAGVVEFCRSFDEADCERREVVGGGGSVGQSRITEVPTTGTDEDTARIGWDLLGPPARWRLRNALLWVDLTGGMASRPAAASDQQRAAAW
jgi:hypothetical protein